MFQLDSAEPTDAQTRKESRTVASSLSPRSEIVKSTALLPKLSFALRTRMVPRPSLYTGLELILSFHSSGYSAWLVRYAVLPTCTL